MPPTPTSVGMETAQETLARSQRMTATPARPVDPVITGDDITEPPAPVRVPGPAPLDTPENFVRTSASPFLQSNIDTLTRAREEDQARFESSQEDLNSLLGEGAPDQRELISSTLSRLGTPDAFRNYENTVNELSALNTNFDVQNVQIAEGNSIGQAQREVSQNERERAVRTAGLAARAEMLRGNIDLARSIARDTANFAMQERSNQLDTLIRQTEAARAQASETDKRLFDARLMQYQEQKAEIQAVKQSIAQAVATGAATNEDLAVFSDPSVSQEQKAALAQRITGRAATQDRQLEIADAESAIAARNASIAQGWARVNLAERKFNYEQQQDALAAELEALQDAGEITEQQAAQQQKVESALRLKDLTSQIRGHAGFNLSVGSVGSRFLNPAEGGLGGQLYNYLSGQGEGFDALYDQLTESLTLDNLDKMSGVLTDRDIQVLRSAATRLRKTTTEAEFLNTLDEMDAVFTRTIEENGVTPQQAKFYYGTDEQTLNEANAVWGDQETTTPATASIGGSYDF